MAMVKENITTVTLGGAEKTVQFDRPYPYFWIKSASGTVYAAMHSGIVPDADGVITVEEGTSSGTMHGYEVDTVYLSGSGKAAVMGTYSANNPFKSGAKGGGESGGLDYFTTAAYYAEIAEENN